MKMDVKIYPKPSRSFAKGRVRGTEYFKEIDVGKSEALFDDCRPGLIEHWYDIETQLFCITAFYSSNDIEHWESDQHCEYLIRNNIMKSGQTECTINKCVDEAGMPMWSASWVIDK